MRKPIDEISDYIIMKLIRERVNKGINISSVASREEVTEIINKLLDWAKENRKFINDTTIDITDLL